MRSCVRCGSCCEKGGPSFHLADKQLIEAGIIHTRDLYTIRTGERVRDNVMGCLTTAHTEIIKIKGRDRTWACRFYEPSEKSCRIYADRPVECRVLKCWETREIEALYARDRLGRRDLLNGIKGLWSLIEDHEQRCAYTKLDRAVRDLEGGSRNAAISRIMEMVGYDKEIRRLVVERGNLEAGMTDFIFGRALTETMGMYGYRVKLMAGRYSLVRVL